ncbi:MAG: biotin--[acetyl-CoA-carboxylase] ligase [Verrucomicrobiota bacterium]|nr:biotin--[acetyl-CoA-carboxylase] ligase [Verrucomicrobiota bacterium]
MRNTDIVILKALLESRPAFVSGNLLATELGISRVGVWARLEKLREQDFSFEAVRHRGYRLVEEPEVLVEDLIRAYLEMYQSSLDVLVKPQVESTNSEAERLLAAGNSVPLVVLAGQQTAGRGRLGRVWHSPGDGNIYASFAFRPKLPPARLQRITLWIGAKIAELLNREYHLPVRIKWPNDLILDGKKVAGILTEARIDADATRDLIFGIGLNVNSKTKRWPKELAAVATSLCAHRAPSISINQLAARLIQTVQSAYNCYLFGQIDDEFRVLWENLDFLKGQTVSTTISGQSVSGIADGVDKDGCLRLILPDKSIITLNSGEVSLGTAATLKAITPGQS